MLKSQKIKVGLAVLAFVLGGGAIASVGNDVPSCYAANKMQVPAPGLDREIFVVIDQTTVLDSALANAVLENVWGFLQPNSAFTVAKFSAFSQGRYTEVVTSGVLEAPVAEGVRDSIGTRQLKKFDECMVGQLAWGKRRAVDAIKASMSSSSADLAKSDILAALKDLSQRVKESKAKRKVVFLISDMLENSSVSSFYAAGAKVRKVEPAKELSAVARVNLFGDFGGAHVHVLGAGLLGPDANAKTYRDPQTMGALKEFWSAYFQKSGAELDQFGEPALIKPVR